MKYNFSPTTANNVTSLKQWVSNELVRVQLAVNDTTPTASDIAKGTPHIESLSAEDIRVVAGSIKQNATDRTKWDYQNDSDSQTVGVTGTQATASNTAITLNFDQTYSKCLSFVVSADDDFASTFGINVGAQATGSSATIKANCNFSGGAQIRWVGTQWAMISQAGSQINPTFSSYSNGLLNFTHDYCRGSAISADPYSDGNYITNPYLPVFNNAAENAIARIQWMDPTTGNLLTNSTPSTRMGVVFMKSNSGPLYLDGTNDSQDINGNSVETGEISFMGLFIK
tara:strand:- start:1009 stop:1860 length:852 start_codon:yes stop_codon:yes gene_type:complete